MGAGVNTPAPQRISLAKQFEDSCPFYMAIGMTYEEYWNGPPELAKYYRESYKVKRDMDNQKLWLQGLYFYTALCDVSPVLNAFAKSGTKPIEYIKRPIDLDEKHAQKTKEENEKEKMNAIKDKMMAFMNVHNDKIKKKKGSDTDAGD